MEMVVVVGVPGVGKSSVLEHVCSQLPFIKILNYGDAMLEEVGGERDAMRKLSVSQQQAVGLRAAERLASEVGPLLIDTHAVIRTPEGFCSGLPDAVLDVLRPSALVVIEAKPELVLQRRQGDPRSRDSESLEEVAQHQLLTRQLMQAASSQRRCPLLIVDNNRSPEAAAAPVIDLMAPGK